MTGLHSITRPGSIKRSNVAAVAHQKNTSINYYFVYDDHSIFRQQKW